MLISDEIAKMIEQMLESGGGILELKRNELATRMGCVPSQINYVISSRFSPSRGYIVESRRGGGGYVKITKVNVDKSTYLMHFLGALGDSVDQETARAFITSLLENGLVSSREAKLIFSMLTDKALYRAQEKETRDALRADLFKNLLLSLI